jgi:hypothetical protein
MALMPIVQKDKSLLRRVDQYLNDLDELIGLVGDKPFLTAEQKRLVQQKLKILKQRMKGDTDYGVRKAILHFHAAWNTNPISSTWVPAARCGKLRSKPLPR